MVNSNLLLNISAGDEFMYTNVIHYQNLVE